MRLFVSLPHVRQKRHEPCAFDGYRDLSLVLGADVRVARIDEFRLARNEPLQKIGFLVVDVLQIL